MQKNREKALSFAGRTRQTGENEKPPLTVGTVERELPLLVRLDPGMDGGTLHLAKTLSRMCITL